MRRAATASRLDGDLGKRSSPHRQQDLVADDRSAVALDVHGDAVALYGALDPSMGRGRDDDGRRHEQPKREARGPEHPW